MSALPADRTLGSDPKLVSSLLGIFSLVLATASLVLLMATPKTASGDVASVERALAGDSNLPQASSDKADAGVSPVPDGPNQQAAESSELAFAPNPVNLLEELRVDPGRVPVGLEIGEIGVEAPVVRYGVDELTGQMDVPNNVTDVAWYQFGPSPGQAGSSVLAAHVDLAAQGPGVFHNLGDLEPGDRVRVIYDDETHQFFEVKARVTYEKDVLPLDTIFSRRGAPVLTLITCGGGFSRSTQSYDSNVVVYAVPEQLEDQSSLAEQA